ncbi:MAG: carbon-nitrogen hydrolase family protein [Chloroflexi bacterium]|nr:MAG: carbon-nitrogen hydrolase family protein [Chloroflexota bacterium]
MKVKICAAQMGIIPLNVKENTKKAELLIETAAKEGCDIICFPEYFLTGAVADETLKYAQGIPGAYTEKFCKLAKEQGLHIIMGTIIEKIDENYYNTSVLIDDSGRIVGKYSKSRLWFSEKKYLKEGNKTPVFETKFGRVGITICWDLAFPEIIKEMALKGAKIVFCPSHWYYEDKYGAFLYYEDQYGASTAETLRKKVPEHNTDAIFVDACASARAIENELVHIFVNAADRYRNFSLLGRTQINVPFYGRIASIESNEEKLLIRDLDLDLVDLAEEVYRIREEGKR